MHNIVVVIPLIIFLRNYRTLTVPAIDSNLFIDMKVESGKFFPPFEN